MLVTVMYLFFFFQAEDGIRDFHVTGVQTCALPIYEHVRVDQGAAAQSAGDERLEPLERPEIEHPVLAVARVPEVPRHVVRRACERTRRICLAALEQTHAQPTFREPERRHRAAEPRADDDRVEVFRGGAHQPRENSLVLWLSASPRRTFASSSQSECGAFSGASSATRSAACLPIATSAMK